MESRRSADIGIAKDGSIVLPDEDWEDFDVVGLCGGNSLIDADAAAFSVAIGDEDDALGFRRRMSEAGDGFENAIANGRLRCVDIVDASRFELLR